MSPSGPPSIFDFFKIGEEKEYTREEYMNLGKVHGPCLNRAVNTTFQGLLAGGLYGIIDLSWNPDRYAVTTVQRGGKAVQVFSANQFSIISNACKGPMIWMALSGLSFSGVDCFLESVRMKKDHWNAVGGGMAAGIVMSSVHRRIDYMIATSLFCGLCMGVADFCGSTIFYDWERMDYVRDDSRRETFVESKAMADLKEKYKKYFVDENGREIS